MPEFRQPSLSTPGRSFARRRRDPRFAQVRASGRVVTIRRIRFCGWVAETSSQRSGSRVNLNGSKEKATQLARLGGFSVDACSKKAGRNEPTRRCNMLPCSTGGDPTPHPGIPADLPFTSLVGRCVRSGMPPPSLLPTYSALRKIGAGPGRVEDYRRFGTQSESNREVIADSVTRALPHVVPVGAGHLSGDGQSWESLVG